jgi:hypothetical protein
LPDGEIGGLYHIPAQLAHFSSYAAEKASIDEAFIDFTRPVRAELLARYPYLSQVPPDAPNGLDTVLPPPPPILWENRGILIPLDPSLENSDPTHVTGAHADADANGDDVPSTWHDVALSIAAELMDKIRAEVRTQLGYTTSAVRFINTEHRNSTVLSHTPDPPTHALKGIARNKFLAKVRQPCGSWSPRCC